MTEVERVIFKGPFFEKFVFLSLDLDFSLLKTFQVILIMFSYKFFSYYFSK